MSYNIKYESGSPNSIRSVFISPSDAISFIRSGFVLPGRSLFGRLREGPFRPSSTLFDQSTSGYIDTFPGPFRARFGYYGLPRPRGSRLYSNPFKQVSVDFLGSKTLPIIFGRTYNFHSVINPAYALFHPEGLFPLFGSDMTGPYPRIDLPSNYASLVSFAPALDEVNYKIRKKVSDSSADLGTNLATLNQTLDMFATCIDFIRNYKRTKLDDFRDAADLYSSAWLTFSYGFKPLISDLYELLQLLLTGSLSSYTRRVTGRSRVTSLSTVRVRSNSQSLSYQVFDQVGNLRFQSGSQLSLGVACFETSYHLRSSCLVKRLDTVRVDPEHILQQLNIINLSTIGWELIPFSFVLDWFIKVGEFLSLQSSHYGVEVIESVLSTTYQHDIFFGGSKIAKFRVFDRQVYDSTSPRTFSVGSGGPLEFGRSITPTLHSSPSVPYITVQRGSGLTPGVNMRFANALALVTQLTLPKR